MLDEIIQFSVQRQNVVAEFLMGTTAFLWGIWLINPFWDTFDLPSFAGFASLGSELLWGTIYAVIGLIVVIASMTPYQKVRQFMAFVQMIIWVFAATGFALDVPQNTAVPVYIMLSIISFWLYIRLMFLEPPKRRRFRRSTDPQEGEGT